MKLLPIDTVAHRTHGWQSPPNLKFAQGQSLVPLVFEELSTALAHYPLAFVRTNPTDWQLVALTGLQQGTNHCVDAQGRWRNAYVPSALRGYPFALVSPPGQADKAVLCIDTGSGCHRPEPDTTRGEHRFFDDEGQPQPLMQRLVSFLQARLANQRLTQAAVQALVEAELLVPWALPDTLKTQPEQTLHAGLYRVDEARLKQLDDAAWNTLRAKNAVPLAYAQLFSMPRLGLLRAFAQQEQTPSPTAGRTTPSPKSAIAQPPAAPVDLGSLGDTLKFS